jgi:16S rRNA (guanine527-N7)-methyltransferase
MKSSRHPPESAPDLAADRARALALINVSRETLARLDTFVELLLQRQRTTNLIASSTIPVLWTRHIADSLQLLALAPAARVWADLGSGGGFPGLVLACALAEFGDAKVHLIESIGKKAAFLGEAAKITKSPAIIHNLRIEQAIEKIGKVDVVTARALAPLPKLFDYIEPLVRDQAEWNPVSRPDHAPNLNVRARSDAKPVPTFADRALMKRGAQALLLKGQDVEAELTQAAKYWNIEFTLAPSITSPEGRIVIVRNLQRIDKNR